MSGSVMSALYAVVPLTLGMIASTGGATAGGGSVGSAGNVLPSVEKATRKKPGCTTVSCHFTVIFWPGAKTAGIAERGLVPPHGGVFIAVSRGGG
jgi:hypothetical protein